MVLLFYPRLSYTKTNDAVTVAITNVKIAVYSSKTEGTLPTIHLVKILTRKTVNHEQSNYQR